DGVQWTLATLPLPDVPPTTFADLRADSLPPDRLPLPNDRRSKPSPGPSDGGHKRRGDVGRILPEAASSLFRSTARRPVPVRPRWPPAPSTDAQASRTPTILLARGARSK